MGENNTNGIMRRKRQVCSIIKGVLAKASGAFPSTNLANTIQMYLRTTTRL